MSPEAVDESLAMAAAFRKIPTRDPYAPNFQPYNDVYSDKLQVRQLRTCGEWGWSFRLVWLPLSWCPVVAGGLVS